MRNKVVLQISLATLLILGLIGVIFPSDENKRISIAEAKIYAENYIKQNKIKWTGAPIEVVTQEEYGRYIIKFKTPVEEQGIVGNRGVFVSFDGKLISLMPQL